MIPSAFITCICGTALWQPRCGFIIAYLAVLSALRGSRGRDGLRRMISAAQYTMVGFPVTQSRLVQFCGVILQNGSVAKNRRRRSPPFATQRFQGPSAGGAFPHAPPAGNKFCNRTVCLCFIQPRHQRLQTLLFPCFSALMAQRRARGGKVRHSIQMHTGMVY